MKFLYAILIVSVLFGCKSAPKTEVVDYSKLERKYASTFDQSKLEDRFQSLMADYKKNSQSAAVNAVYLRLIRIYFRVDHLIREYDESLAKAPADCHEDESKEDTRPLCNPMQSETYKKIQVYRSLKEEVLFNFSYFYLRFLEYGNIDKEEYAAITEAGKADRVNYWKTQLFKEVIEEKRDIATQAVNWIESNLDKKLAEGKESGEYPAYWELKNTTRSVIFFYCFTAKPGCDKDPRVLRDFEDLNDYYTSFRARIDRQIEKYKNQDDEEFAERLRLLNEIERSRDPQSHRPSTGRDGNVTGNTFPRGQWALTYDDGPHPTRTQQILDILTRNNAHATFFWLAKNVMNPANRQVVENVKAAGMGLASHSYNHKDLSKQGANLQHEIVDAKRDLESIYGQTLNYFRLPYGAGLRKTSVRQVIADQGMLHFFWNVDSLDWQDRDPQSILRRVKQQMATQKRGVILFHDVHQQTVGVTRLLFSDPEVFGGNRFQLRPLEELAEGPPANGGERVERRSPRPVGGQQAARAGQDIPLASEGEHYRRVKSERLELLSGNPKRTCGYLKKDDLFFVSNNREGKLYLIKGNNVELFETRVPNCGIIAIAKYDEINSVPITR